MSNETKQLFFSYYENGYVAEYAFNESEICTSWILIPAENLWTPGVRAFLYVLAMVYLFIGVAIGSDVFMTSIEMITSKKRCVMIFDPEQGKEIAKEVFVWNETVANLTLLALGSSAPEILLATFEAITEISQGKTSGTGGLGFYTIMGSAAFNLLIITAICIMSVPSPQAKPLKELGVFILTAIWSLMAYVWLLAVVSWFSPGEILIWEAVVTLLFFPFLVLTAYAQDNRWWVKRWRQSRVSNFSASGGEGTKVSSIQLENGLQPLHKRIEFSNEEAENAGILESNLNDMPMESITNGYQESKVLNKTSQVLPTIEEEPVKPQVYQPFARARIRHAVIKALGGAGKLNLANALARPHEEEAQPKLLNIVKKIAEENKIFSANTSMNVQSAASVAFASPSYSIMEDAGELKVDVLLFYRARMKKMLNNGTDETADNNNPAYVGSIEYETREASAKENKDFVYTTGTLKFTEDMYVQTISVPIINDDQYNPDTDFYIILKNPAGDVCLGDPSVCRVTIIDDDKPGDFVLESSQLYADMEQGYLQVVVIRENGSDGNVSVDFATVNGTAKGGVSIGEGVDYIINSGTLPFKHQEQSKTVKIYVNKEVTSPKNFVFVLRNPSQGSHLGEHTASVINMNVDAGIIGPGYVVGSDDDETWLGQFRSAMEFGREFDGNGGYVAPGKFEYLLHFLTFFWKFFFAIVPPRTLLGGYPAFLASLALIGLLTAIIEQLGTLLACAVKLNSAVTGITIIAIGTSLPDTFASRTAAMHHDYADASIGNITGSNSVNVFLGLGIPWLIRSIYASTKNTTYTVDDDGIDFAIIIFDSFGAVCISLLLFRRWFVGGELGGKFTSKCLTSGFLLLLWFTYVIVVVLKSYSFF